MKRFRPVFAAAFIVAALLVPSVAFAVDPVAVVPPYDGEPQLTVPANTPLYVPAGWITATRGRAMKAPKFMDWYLEIYKHTDAGKMDLIVSVSLAESDAFWLKGVVPAVQVEPMAADWSPFNPRIGAKLFAKSWRYDIADGLAAGVYTVKSGCVQNKTVTDMLWVYEGQHSPMKLEAGAYDFPEWDFIVQ